MMASPPRRGRIRVESEISAHDGYMSRWIGRNDWVVIAKSTAQAMIVAIRSESEFPTELEILVRRSVAFQFFKLDDPKRIPNFVSSVSEIIRKYDFDGIDIDFESPSLVLAPGDVDFKNPTTPSVVNLIAGIRQLHDEFGSSFMMNDRICLDTHTDTNTK